MPTEIIQKFCFSFQKNMYAPEVKGNKKYHVFSAVKDVSPSALSAYFCINSNFAELQLLPVMAFSFNILSC